MLANAFTDADREDRAQRRQRAEVLAERRLTAPMPAGRTHTEVSLRLPHLVELDRGGRRRNGAVTGAA